MKISLCVSLLLIATVLPSRIPALHAASLPTLNPTSLAFTATVNGAPPASKTVTVTYSGGRLTVTASGQTDSSRWLSVSPSGTVSRVRTLTVSVNISGLTANTYQGQIRISSGESSETIPVQLTVSATSTGGGSTSAGYKLIGWNDLGMHCMDGKDYSVFAVLPPYNTIHAHLISQSGTLVNTDVGYTVTYQAIKDPLTGTINTSSASKTNFWQYAAKLGFGNLATDTGLAGYSMPGAKNTPQGMTFTPADNTWTATGIPILPYADGSSGAYPTNYLPMMRLTAKNSLGTVLATTDIVLPISDEMTCSVCHASTSNAAAKPAAGWVNNPDPAKDVKLNILRKHDDRFKGGVLFNSAAAQTGYNTAGLEATSATQPLLCAKCHGSNALGLSGVTGVEPLTTAMHNLHAGVTDPATNQTMGSATVRDSCYRCHPGPKTQCLRGAMGNLKTSTGANAIECQSCHGSMSNVATATRHGWLDEPSCQSCHTGTAVSNSGQIVYTSVFSSSNIVRTAPDQTFATNPNTPAVSYSLYRFSKGHGGLQCEACHGSTHAEFVSANINDNVQSTALQGHAGTLAECGACHNPVPSTINGGPHGLHPVGASWVSAHHDYVERSGSSSCKTCHGLDYRGTILSKTQADRTMGGHSFPRGTVIGCYSCHNGPNGG
jgi:hypothetical protein